MRQKRSEVVFNGGANACEGGALNGIFFMCVCVCVICVFVGMSEWDGNMCVVMCLSVCMCFYLFWLYFVLC